MDASGAVVRSPGQSRLRMANQILALVREEKCPSGFHLREQHLGTRLGVSRTPVRSALTLLAELGVVEARRHHGFFLKATPDILDVVHVEVPNAIDQRLGEQIVQDRLAGHLPVSMTQSDIAQRYGVDRVVLLRTLARLAEDGLVVRNKGHGWTFLPALDTRQALEASYGFRLTLEPASILLDSFRPDEAALENSRQQHLHLLSRSQGGNLESKDIFEVDASFHEMIAGFARNTFFLQAIQQQNRLRRLLEFGSYGNRRRMGAWCREHLAIIAALQARKVGRASLLMERHLASALKSASLLAGRAKRAG